MLIFCPIYSLYFTCWQPICTHRDEPSRIEELMKLTRNKRHFYRHGRSGCNQAKAWFLARFVTPSEITKTFWYHVRSIDHNIPVRAGFWDGQLLAGIVGEPAPTKISVPRPDMIWLTSVKSSESDSVAQLPYSFNICYILEGCWFGMLISSRTIYLLVFAFWSEILSFE